MSCMTVTVSGQELWAWRAAAQQQIEQQLSYVPASELLDRCDRTRELLSELDWLVQAVANLDRLSLRLETFRERTTLELNLPLSELTQRWQQRLTQQVPVQYLLGRAPWRGLWLRVSPAVLIPRPETEEMIDLAVQAATQAPVTLDLTQGHWADLGTGSGAIALSLALALPAATIHAVDSSTEALAIAAENLAQFQLEDRVALHQGAWLEPLNSFRGQLRGIVSNPPYIPTAEISALQPEVAQHEPHLALDGGEDGLDCIRQIVLAAPDYLCPGGVLLLEMMAGQSAAVRELLTAQGSYTQIQSLPDLSGTARFALAYRC